MRAADLEGMKFGRLSVLTRTENMGKQTRWIVLCECGTKKAVAANSLTSGRAKSCGCLRAELTSQRRGGAGDGAYKCPLYPRWRNMVRRCHVEGATDWEHYGARGISVAPEWRESFRSFEAWVMHNLGAPSPGTSLDRIDNEGHYEPGNLRWASASEQSLNRRRQVHRQEHESMIAERDLWRDRAVALGWLVDLPATVTEGMQA